MITTFVENNAMPKKKEATNLVLTFLPEDYELLQQLSEKDHRSLKNYGEKVMLEHLQQFKVQKKELPQRSQRNN